MFKNSFNLFDELEKKVHENNINNRGFEEQKESNIGKEINIGELLGLGGILGGLGDGGFHTKSPPDDAEMFRLKQEKVFNEVRLTVEETKLHQTERNYSNLAHVE